MIRIIDFSNCELSPRNLEYGGRAEEKWSYIKTVFGFLKFTYMRVELWEKTFRIAENNEKWKNKTKLYWNSKMIKL